MYYLKTWIYSILHELFRAVGSVHRTASTFQIGSSEIDIVDKKIIKLKTLAREGDLTPVNLKLR